MKTVGELIERNAALYPNNTAFVLDQQRLSYAEYARRARCLASALETLGLLRQDRVGILSANSIEYFEVYGACEWSGYIVAPYNFRCAGPELVHFVLDSAPRVVFFEAAFAPLIASVRDQLGSVDHWVCIDAAGSAEPLAEWAQCYHALLASGDPAGPRQRARVDDIAYIFYTSGTTGRPKGVSYSHTAALTVAQRQGRHIGADARLLQITPAFHVGGKGFPLGVMWMSGTTVLARSFDPLKFLQSVQEERITYCFVVAPMLQAIMDHPRIREFDLSSLRHAMAASAATPVVLLRRAIEVFGPVFFVAYGSTEAGNVCTLEKHEMRINGSPADIARLASVGHFNPEIEAAVLDEQGQPCAPGVAGEICVKSPVFQGYWNNSVATIEATRSGWLHTGDMGYLDEENYLFLVDRKKDMIISGGENIYSREVEEALSLHPSVAIAAVIGVPDATWGESVKAIVSLRPGAELGENELIEHCRQHIARYKCPRSIAFVVELPLLGSGKIDKVSLRKRYAAV
ncbi:MAG: AMP-binding protein [Pseudomonadota bacterium]